MSTDNGQVCERDEFVCEGPVMTEDRMDRIVR